MCPSIRKIRSELREKPNRFFPSLLVSKDAFFPWKDSVCKKKERKKSPLLCARFPCYLSVRLSFFYQFPFVIRERERKGASLSNAIPGSKRLINESHLTSALNARWALEPYELAWSIFPPRSTLPWMQIIIVPTFASRGVHEISENYYRLIDMNKPIHIQLVPKALLHGD